MPGLNEDAEAALRRSAAALPPGWLLLAGDALRRDAPWAGSIEAALIHADTGVALLGAEPATDAAGKLKQALDAAGFPRAFGGCPPIVYRVLPPPGLPLQELLDEAFALEPAFALTGGADWFKAVQDALAARGDGPAATPTPRASAPPPARAAEAPAARPRAPVPRPLARGGILRRRHRFAPMLVGGFAMVVLVGLAVALHSSGPLGPRPAGSPGGAERPAPPGSGAAPDRPGPAAMTGQDARPEPSAGPTKGPTWLAVRERAAGSPPGPARPAPPPEAAVPEPGVAPANPAKSGQAASPLMEAEKLLPAVVMGVVEGLTEFLPISSTGHLILLGEVIGFHGPPGKVFEISIQFGAVLAVVWLLRDVWWRIATRGWVPGTPAQLYARNTLLAFLPAMALGATLHGPITERLFSPFVVAVALVLGGVALVAFERLRPAPRIRSVLEISAAQALLIGLGQALALVPGTSRSGATIIMALLVGVERRTAVEFSFMLAVPTMMAATAYSLWQSRAALDSSVLGQIAVGFVVSFVVALAVVRWMLAAIGRIGFAPFGWYRIALGAAILAWLVLR